MKCSCLKLFGILNLMRFLSIVLFSWYCAYLRVSFTSLIIKRILCFCLEGVSPSKTLVSANKEILFQGVMKGAEGDHPAYPKSEFAAGDLQLLLPVGRCCHWAERWCGNVERDLVSSQHCCSGLEGRSACTVGLSSLFAEDGSAVTSSWRQRASGGERHSVGSLSLCGIT